MRDITKKAIEAFNASKPFHLGNTSVTSIDKFGGAGPVSLWLHGNCIARRFNTGKIEITTAGWNTLTTRARLNGLPGVAVYQKAGQLYLNGKEWDGGWIVICS